MALVKLTTKQVATLVNDATKEYLGETAVLQETLQPRPIHRRERR